METLKTAAVVVILLAVLYGVYLLLNQPGEGDAETPAELAGDGPGVDIPDFPEPPSFTPSGDETVFPPSPAAAPGPKPPLDSHAGYSQPRDDAYVEPTYDEPAPPNGQVGSSSFERDWKAAAELIRQEKYVEALSSLSIYFDSRDLNAEQQESLLAVLDFLASEVIYSREAWEEAPYEVRRNETLHEIAKKYNVPAQLLANINGIENLNLPLPGSEIKIVRGPFRAEIIPRSGAEGELTLFKGDLYAGRFPIRFGREFEKATSQHYVLSKHDSRAPLAYELPDGRTLAPDDPGYPYGRYQINLGSEVVMHDAPAEGDEAGCIILNTTDLFDVASILSIDSTVRVRR